MNKIKIGDVFEIDTAKGKAYIQYVYSDKKIGEMVRVLPELYTNTPDHIEEIIKKKELFFIFFPLKYAVRRKILKVICHTPINDGFKKPKHMRSKHIIQGNFLGWHIVDTDTWQVKLVKELSEKQKEMSPWGIWNDTLLKERLETNWALEKWV